MIAFRDARLWSLKSSVTVSGAETKAIPSPLASSSLLATKLMSRFLPRLPKKKKKKRFGSVYKPWQHHRSLSNKVSWDLCHSPEHPLQAALSGWLQNFPALLWLALFLSLVFLPVFSAKHGSKVVLLKVILSCSSPSLNLQTEHKDHRKERSHLFVLQGRIDPLTSPVFFCFFSHCVLGFGSRVWAHVRLLS